MGSTGALGGSGASIKPAFSSPMRIGINGFGRIGRLVFRALWGRPGIELVHVNDSGGDAASAAHLLAFDSVHGRWPQALQSNHRGFFVGGKAISTSQESDPTAVPWRAAGVELLLECTGRFKTPQTLQPYFDRCDLPRVLVACPVKGEIAGAEALNVVFGINHGQYDPARRAGRKSPVCRGLRGNSVARGREPCHAIRGGGVVPLNPCRPPGGPITRRSSSGSTRSSAWRCSTPRPRRASTA